VDRPDIHRDHRRPTHVSSSGQRRQGSGDTFGPAVVTPPRWMGEWPIAYPRPSGDWTVAGQLGWARLDPERGTVRRVEPVDDARLPALARTLRRGKLVGYRAGRRAVVATGNGFVKVVRPERAQRIVSIHEAMSAASLAFSVPRVTAATGDGAIDLGRVPGRSLHDLIRRGSGDGAIADGAAALVALHSAAPPEMLESGTPDTACRWVGVVGRAEPDAVDALMPIAARVDREVAAAHDRCIGSETVIVHGDCHDKNLFLDGGGAGFIDLDSMRLGRREEDVANLAVHVALRALQAGETVRVARGRRDVVVDAYARAASIDDVVLVVLERTVWFRLACLYRFRSTSRRLVPTLLELATSRR
jgi:hypothetical protein